MEKLPPQSKEAEESLLSCLITSKEGIFEVLNFISKDDFYFDINAKMFVLVIEMFEEGVEIDIITAKQKTIDKGIDKEITLSYLTSLFNSSAYAKNIVKYAQIVKDKSIRRQLLKAQSENNTVIYDEDKEINNVLATTQNNIFRITPLKVKSDNIKSVLSELEELQREYSKKYQEGKKIIGYSSGIERLDNIIDGLRPGHFWVIGGWHGTGKTSFALNIVHSLIEQEVPVSLITLEMSQVDLAAKIIGIRHEISSMRIIKGINTPEISERIKEGKFFMSRSNVEIHTEFELEKIKLQIRKDVYTRKTRVIVIDYLQKISAGNIYDETPLASKASKELANLAQELKITIILLSQISNEAQKGGGAGAGFKGSGTIEASADLAIVLKREKDKEIQDNETVPIKIIITKNKFGLDGAINYYMHLPSGKFVENYEQKPTIKKPNEPKF